MKRHPTVKPETARMLRRIQKKILAEPRQFEMESFFTTHLPRTWQKIKIPNCGTAACIAGWGICLVNKINPAAGDKLRGDLWEMGRQALKITSSQSLRLFDHLSWPHPYEGWWTDTPKTHRLRLAEIACARIDHFIKTGE